MSATINRKIGQRIQGIVFDLDNTILDRDATFEQFIGDQYDRVFAALCSVPKEEFIAIARRHDNHGYTAKSKVYAALCEETATVVDIASLEEDYQRNYGSRPILFDNAIEVLESLQVNYRLALVTNGSAQTQNRKIDISKIRKYFSAIKISEEEGIKKPDLEIYRRCLRDMKLEPADCIVIGDHPELDVQAGTRCGMRAIWKRTRHFDPPDSCDGVVDRLSEIPGLLGELGEAA